MNLSLKDKVALVTGAASGMGLAAAQAFAAEGAAVVLADVNIAVARATAEQLVTAGHKAIAIRCDVSDEAQVKAMVEQTRLHLWPPGCGVQQRRCRESDRGTRGCIRGRV